MKNVVVEKDEKIKTPFTKALNKIYLGLFFSTLVFNLSYIQIILPFFAYISLVLGTRTLVNQNNNFKKAYIISSIQLFLLMFVSIYNSTITHALIDYSFELNAVIIFIKTVLTILLIKNLHQGLYKIQDNHDIKTKLNSFVSLIIWYILFFIFALVRAGTFIGIAMIIAYIFVIAKMHSEIKLLYEFDGFIKYKEYKNSNIIFTLIMTVVLIICMSLAYAFGNSYPMNWSALDKNEHDKVQDIKAELLKKDFPEMVLNDLDVEDIKSIENAVDVFYNTSEYIMLDDKNTITLSDIIVKLQNEKGREFYKVFHHFSYEGDVKSFGTNCIQVLWDYEHGVSSLLLNPNGRLLYDDEKTTYTANFYSLYQSDTRRVWGDDIISETRTDGILANYSLPRLSTHPRGYVSYTAHRESDNRNIISHSIYVLQKSLFQYPAITAEEGITKYGDVTSYSGVFDMIYSHVFTRTK